MRATITDVAREAGFSISTVSYAINGKRHVTEKTRKHILTVARRLNYVPNVQALKLKRSETKTIGVFFDSWFSLKQNEVIQGIEQHAHRNGYSIIACSLYGGDKSTALKYLKERRLDGAIVLDSSMDDCFLKRIASEHLPIVVIGNNIEAENIYSLVVDDFGGAFNATKAMIQKGINKVLYLGGSNPCQGEQKRLEGYIAAIGYCNVPLCPDSIVECGNSEAEAYQAMSELLAKGMIPEGVLCTSGEIAAGAMKAAKERNLDISQHMKQGFLDGESRQNPCRHSIAILSHSKRVMGEMASKAMLGVLNGKSIEQVQAVPVNLIERYSV